jgi:hypothetical protein
MEAKNDPAQFPILLRQFADDFTKASKELTDSLQAHRAVSQNDELAEQIDLMHSHTIAAALEIIKAADIIKVSNEMIDQYEIIIKADQDEIKAMDKMNALREEHEKIRSEPVRFTPKPESRTMKFLTYFALIAGMTITAVEATTMFNRSAKDPSSMAHKIKQCFVAPAPTNN